MRVFIPAGPQQLLPGVFSGNHKDSNPAVMSPAGEQFNHLIKRRAMKIGPILRQHTFDFSQQCARRAIGFQGQIPNGSLEARLV